MSRRQRPWHLVHHAADPVPADSNDVLDVASTVARLGQRLRQAHAELERIDQGSWKGDAAKRFADQADHVLDDLDKAALKYEDAAAALRAYARAVERPRLDSAEGVDDAVNADARIRSNQHSYLTGVHDPDPAQIADDEARRRRLAGARTDLAAAQRLVDGAVHELEVAAKAAAASIKQASAQIKDGHWDDIRGFVVKSLKIVLAVLTVVSIILVALAVLVASPVLAALALAVGIAILLVTAALYAMGEATREDMFWSVVGVIPFGRLAKLSSKLLGPFRYLSRIHVSETLRVAQATISRTTVIVGRDTVLIRRELLQITEVTHTIRATARTTDLLASSERALRPISGLLDAYSESAAVRDVIHGLRAVSNAHGLDQVRVIGGIVVGGTGALGELIPKLKDLSDLPDALDTLRGIDDLGDAAPSAHAQYEAFRDLLLSLPDTAAPRTGPGATVLSAPVMAAG